MNIKSSERVFTFEREHPQVSSVRAKAFVFHDPISKHLLKIIERLAPSEAPILIYGETGTGKELVARHIHTLSGRKGAFVSVNCGAINEQLAESELFGHEAGSFTGAVGQRKGWFEVADGGTLFLDEIGDLPLNLQVKLLRVLQEKEVTRVGARHPIPINVRIISATNIDLNQAVQVSSFRQDLLFRINIATVDLKPLRERKGDILPLVKHFIAVYQHKYKIEHHFDIEPIALAALLEYKWHGNIRELENVIHYAVLMSDEGVIQVEHLKLKMEQVAHVSQIKLSQSTFSQVAQKSHSPNDHQQFNQNELSEVPSSLEVIALALSKIFKDEQVQQDVWDHIERLTITSAYAATYYNQVKTAEKLGITRNMVRTLLKRHHLIMDGK
ncbi:sigma-54 interaction domain-containing protein [Acinetobacter sp. WCHAc060025]|uniref:sigma-54 interaction domain-containing protein n=1 Tax=Acinetobacter sp. WCHAc060025 TaxID=2518625 RepID=UPI001022CB7C|nr:sigma-54 dependent transcriptional regulator [Acinetobacter sp. WCHAc060025]RZG74072.1 sigma-54-dependent Fis family transcriptional regulator [Acinetobacter sp. WCHAc060025]